MEWYYTQNDTQSGPVTEQQLAELVRTRSVLPNELAWREGMEDWEAISQIDTFKRSIPPPPAPPTASAGGATTGSTAGRTPSGRKIVVNPYQRPSGQAGSESHRPPPKIENGLALAILAVLCCTIPGVVAVVYASQVNGHVARGDYRRAQDAANSAKTWTWVALGLGITAIVLQIAIGFSSGY